MKICILFKLIDLSINKYNIRFTYPHSVFGDLSMDLEAHKQKLSSFDVNPDEIENNRYATAFRIQFAIIEKQNEENEFLKKRTKS